MTAREQFANNAQDTLDGAIDASQTTLDLNDASEFPSAGNFRIKIDSEIMLATARSTNTLTVVRGIEGTSGASHGNGTGVHHILTDASMNTWLRDAVVLAGDD
jgi:hypothetical protein